MLFRKGFGKMEEQDRKDKEKLKKILIGLGIFLVIGVILGILQHKPPKEFTPAEVTARVEEILAEAQPEQVETDGVTMEQYVASNRDMLYLTELEDGTVRHEFTCKKTQLIYVYSTAAAEDHTAGAEDHTAGEMEVYDVEDYLQQQLPAEETK